MCSGTKGLVMALYNVRNLGQGSEGVRRRKDIKNFFTHTMPRAEILLLQEHHFGADDCEAKTRRIEFKGGAGLWNATFNAATGRFTGGTAILTSARILQSLEHHGVIVAGT